MKKSHLIAAISVAVMASACTVTPRSQHPVYQQNQTAQVQKTEYGTLLSVNQVLLTNDGTVGQYVGTAIGAGLGGYGASHIGGGNAKYASATVGAVLGGTFANEFMKAWNETDGVELTIKKKNGKVITVVQEGQANQFRVGTKVKLLTDNQGIVRVSY